MFKKNSDRRCEKTNRFSLSHRKSLFFLEIIMPYKDIEKQRENARKYRIKNREQIRKYAREYRDKYKEETKEYRRVWNEKNKDKIKEYKKNYRETHLDEFKKRDLEYYNNNKEKIRKYRQEYYRKNSERFIAKAKQMREKSPWKTNYTAAKQRCLNKKVKSYKNYGGKGVKFNITVEEVKQLWFRDKAFNLKCATIDRKDNDGNYEYNNCRFIEKSDNSKKQWTDKKKARWDYEYNSEQDT